MELSYLEPAAYTCLLYHQQALGDEKCLAKASNTPQRLDQTPKWPIGLLICLRLRYIASAGIQLDASGDDIDSLNER